MPPFTSQYQQLVNRMISDVMFDRLTPDALAAFVAQGVDVNVPHSVIPTTALQEAICRKNVTLVEALLGHGAATELAGADGCTPFWNACYRGNADTVRALMAAGAHVDTMDATGMAAIVALVSYGSGDAVERLQAVLESPVVDIDVTYHRASLEMIALEKHNAELGAMIVTEVLQTGRVLVRAGNGILVVPCTWHHVMAGLPVLQRERRAELTQRREWVFAVGSVSRGARGWW